MQFLSSLLSSGTSIINVACYCYQPCQMAFELYGMLAGNVSPMTGENVKPAYGGEEEAFLRKVVTPIYEVIAKVSPGVNSCLIIIFFYRITLLYFCSFEHAMQEAARSKRGKSKHSQWRNYDDLNEYFWYKL